MEDMFFVGIPNATDLRRQILTNSKTTIGILRDYGEYSQLRGEKLESIIQLKKKVDEIIILNKRIKTLLPKVPDIKPRQAQYIAPSQRTTARPVKHINHHVDILEEQLSKIERRLKALE